MTFCHLNLHSDRSIMRGLIKPAKLVEWSKQHGVKAAAVTDYGNVSAIPELYKACKREGIKPIYGMEAYIVDDKTEKKQGHQRIILLAKNRIGFRNLIILATIGSMYFYYIPRIDLSDLQKYGEGLIALTGDLHGGIAAQRYFANPEGGIHNTLDELSDAFGEDNVYFELEPVPSDSQRAYNEMLVQKWNEYGGSLRLVITGDPHYLLKADDDLHENFMTIKNWRNPGWMYPFKGPYHVRTMDEMLSQMASLHGFDVSFVPGFKDAFGAVDEIIDKVELFDIREGVKIPRFVR